MVHINMDLILKKVGLIRLCLSHGQDMLYRVLSDSGKIIFHPIQDTTIAARTANSGWTLNLDLSSNSSFDRTSAIGRCDVCEENVDMNDMRLLPSLMQRVSHKFRY